MRIAMMDKSRTRIVVKQGDVHSSVKITVGLDVCPLTNITSDVSKE